MMWLLWAVVQTAVEDQAAVQRMARGDADALAALYDRHGRLVYSLALRIVRDQGDAEDVVQDTFAQAWRQASRWEPSRGSVVAWLVMLARTRAIDLTRRRRARPELAEAAQIDVADATPSVDQRLEWEGRSAEVKRAVDELPLTQRIAVEMSFFEGLTHSEIAERLEVPLGTVKTRVRQGLLKLKARLAGAIA